MTTQESRHDAVEQLAISIRSLADAAAETAIEPAALAEITTQLDALTSRLQEAVDDTPYSGLVQPPVDYSVPEGPMPLNPIIGRCNPTRPDVHLHFENGQVVGTARLTRRFTGPPGFGHGGISAMLADQIVAVSPLAIGTRSITKALHVHFRRPIPLNEPVDLWGECAVDGDGFTARYTITAHGEVAVDGTAELVPYERLARKSQAGGD